MTISTLKSKFLKTLFKGSRLLIFSESREDGLMLSIKEKIILWATCKNFYAKEYADLKYFMSIPPFSSGSDCFGGIDMAEPAEDGSFAIRGWLFSPDFKIKELELIVNEQRYPVYAFNLNRLDVYEKFYFLPNSENCGFVCLLDGQTREVSTASIKFEARGADGKIHMGGFHG